MRPKKTIILLGVIIVLFPLVQAVDLVCQGPPGSICGYFALVTPDPDGNIPPGAPAIDTYPKTIPFSIDNPAENQELKWEGVDSNKYCNVEGRNKVAFYTLTREGNISEVPLWSDWGPEVIWDSSQSTCECATNPFSPPITFGADAISSTHWISQNPAHTTPGQSGGGCCGDDNNLDQGTLTSLDGQKNLCALTTFDAYRWVSYEEKLDYISGDIWFIDHGLVKYDVVSDGNQWVACNAQGNIDFEGRKLAEGEIFTAYNHDYLCYKGFDGINALGECIGNGITHNRNHQTHTQHLGTKSYGNTFKTGEFAQSIDIPKLSEEHEFGYGISAIGSITYDAPDPILVLEVPGSSQNCLNTYNRDGSFIQDCTTIKRARNKRKLLTQSSIPVSIGETVIVETRSPYLKHIKFRASNIFQLCANNTQILRNLSKDTDRREYPVTCDGELIIPRHNAKLPFIKPNGRVVNLAQIKFRPEVKIWIQPPTPPPAGTAVSRTYLGNVSYLESPKDMGAITPLPPEYTSNYTLSGGTNIVSVSFSPTEDITTTTDPTAHIFARVPEPTDTTAIPSGPAYFCSVNGEWSEGITDRETCEAAGFEWTGSACCGIGFANYNDRYWEYNIPKSQLKNVGGCFQNTKIFHNNVVAEGSMLQNFDFSDNDNYWELSGRATVQDKHLRIGEGSGSAQQEIKKQLFPNQLYQLSADFINFGQQECTPQVTVSRIDRGVDFENVALLSKIDINEPVKTFTMSGIGGILRVAASTSGCKTFDAVTIDNIKITVPEESIKNFNGTFYGCKDNYPYIDSLNQGPLVQTEFQDNPIEACTVIGSHFCSPDNNIWESPNKIGGKPRDTPKEAPPGITGSSCCPSDYCWNGSICVASEADTTSPQNIVENQGNTYKCVEGAWKEVGKSCKWDGSECGYCNDKTQCLVDRKGNSENNNKPELYDHPPNTDNPQCINQGQYIADNYCLGQNWTSRTRLIAQTLLDFVQKKPVGKDNYTLYCDYYKNALVNYNYTDAEVYLGGEAKGGIFQGQVDRICGEDFPFECVNNVCVLRYRENNQQKTALGVSLNKPIDDPDFSFLRIISALPITSCNNLQGGFKQCSGNVIWYSDDINSVIYSRDGINLQLEEDIRSKIMQVIKKIITLDIIIDPLQQTTPIKPSGEDYYNGFAENITHFNRIYINRLNNKIITAVLENPPTNRSDEFLALRFKNIDADICASILRFRNTSREFTTACELQQDQYIAGHEADIKSMWQHLTSKIRLQ